MSPPNGVTGVGSSDSKKIVNPSDERKAYLKNSEFFTDPTNAADPAHLQKQWEEDRDYRVKHFKLITLLDLFTRFMNRDSNVSPQKLKAAIDDWVGSPDFKQDPVNPAVLGNMYRILGSFEAADNAQQAGKVRAMLPEVKKEEPPAKKPDDKAAAPAGDPKKHYAIGLEFQNDSVPLAILDAAGIPVSTLATEKSYFTIKPSFEFPMGSQVGMVRLSGGLFEAKGIPGADLDKSGNGYRVGADFAFVNPYSPSNDRAGIGLELTGVASSAADRAGVPTPSPLVRLHFFNESDWTIPIGGHFDLGFSSLLNHQDTYLVLGNDQKLTPGQTFGKQPAGGPETAPFAYSSSLFTASPIHWFGVSGRYYFNGRPDKDTQEDLGKPFRPGEGLPKLGSLWTAQIINLNRREIVPAFANTQVFLGTFEPLGAQSSTQFDTISLGLSFYSLQDGYYIAKNAQNRGEIFRRGDWLLKGMMIGTDALLLGYNVYRAATAKSDPPTNQTIPEFVKDPGSVTDFKGRAGLLNLKLVPVEAGLTIIDATGIAGNVSDKNLTRFYATSGVAAGLGVLGYLFSAPLSGNGCGPDGTLLRCGFYGQKANYFHTGIDASPANMTSIENQYVMSTTSAALASWGVTRVLQGLLLPKGPSTAAPAGSKEEKKSTALVSDPHLNVAVSPGGANVTFGGRF